MGIRDVLICALACATASAASVVAEVESHNYKALIKKHETVLIDFWAPWCDHCKNLEPEYEAAAYELEKQGVILVKMNIDNKGNRAVANAVGVDGYPGLKVFSNGKLNKRASAHISRIRDGDFLKLFMSKVHKGEEFPKDPEVDDSKFTKNNKKKKKAKHKKGSSSPSPKSADNDVLQLTSAGKFDKALSQNDVLLVMFHAPWCGHCKKMKPSFAKASAVLKKEDIVLAQVDATALRDLAKGHGVSSFPTLKIFHEGVFAEEYEGGRSENDLVTYMRKFASNAGGSGGGGDAPAPAPAKDQCLSLDYCVKNYAQCCSNGNWKKGPDRKPVCKQAKSRL